jgi:hypothetical protein
MVKVKKAGIITTAIALLGILVNLALPSTLAGAQDSNRTVLRFAPSAIALIPNTQGRLDIVIENVEALYGLEFQLAFDPDIIEVIDTNPDEKGVQIQPANWLKGSFVAVNQVDNGSGRIDFAATLLRPAQPVSGNLAVATISFMASNTGSSSISIQSAILSTRNADAIPYTKQAGRIDINPDGQVSDMLASTPSTGPGLGRMALAGAAILAFAAALGVFMYTLRRSR